jgi:hypothetical protein
MYFANAVTRRIFARLAILQATRKMSWLLVPTARNDLAHLGIWRIGRVPVLSFLPFGRVGPFEPAVVDSALKELQDVINEFLVESYENLDELDRDLVALEQDPLLTRH